MGNFQGSSWLSGFQRIIQIIQSLNEVHALKKKKKYQPMREEIHQMEALGLTVRYCLWAM